MNEKKQYKVKLPGSTMLSHDTLEGVKSQPNAQKIYEFNENLKDFIEVCHRVDGVWVSSDQHSMLS